MMDRQFNHLVHLVDDLLNTARISSGKIDLRREPVRLADVLDSSIEASRAAIDTGGHELVVYHGAEPVVVDGDGHRLSQVFSNRLNNAVKYTDRGGRIVVTVGRDAADAVVKSSDNGIGVPAADIPRVFDLFSQVSSHRGRAQEGLSIGLALVKKLVELHGVNVTAESDGPGRGSTFTLRLPVAAARWAGERGGESE